MITNLDAASELFLAQVNRMQGRMSEANRQVSSGKKIASASDAPDQIEPLLQLRTGQMRNGQIQSNLTLAKATADTAESTVAEAIRLMDRALVLANQGASGTMDASGRKSIALDVQSLLEEMVGYSRTMVQGRYIFSGDQDTTPAYDLDLTAPNGVVRLTSSTATTKIEDAAGGAFAAAKTAQEIFDPRSADGTATAANVFAALNGLRVALQTDNQTGIANSVAAIKTASYHLNSIDSFYGSVQRRIEDGSSYAQTNSTRLKVAVSEKEDADVAAAALELSQTSVQMQASFQMRAKLRRSSLFDYLG